MIRWRVQECLHRFFRFEINYQLAISQVRVIHDIANVMAGNRVDRIDHVIRFVPPATLCAVTRLRIRSAPDQARCQLHDPGIAITLGLSREFSGAIYVKY
jgi:hypothetical protein